MRGRGPAQRVFNLPVRSRLSGTHTFNPHTHTFDRSSSAIATHRTVPNGVSTMWSPTRRARLCTLFRPHDLLIFLLVFLQVLHLRVLRQVLRLNLLRLHSACIVQLLRASKTHTTQTAWPILRGSGSTTWLLRSLGRCIFPSATPTLPLNPARCSTSTLTSFHQQASKTAGLARRPRIMARHLGVRSSSPTRLISVGDQTRLNRRPARAGRLLVRCRTLASTGVQRLGASHPMGSPQWSPLRNGDSCRSQPAPLTRQHANLDMSSFGGLRWYATFTKALMHSTGLAPDCQSTMTLATRRVARLFGLPSFSTDLQT